MPESTPSSNFGLYRSGVTSPDRLRHTTVARAHLLDNAVESLRGSVARKSKNHLLFIGPRGIGKTHLLSCIEDAVHSDNALDASVVVVRFPEESNQTLSFADFLIGMCRILKEVLEDEPLWAELFATVQTEEDDASVVDTLVPAIREENRRRGRTLLVMLENLGEILTRQIRDRNGVAALRKFFMAENGCLLVATAPLHFDGITDVGQPFYDFFDIQILESLSFEETVDVIRLNFEWEEHSDTLGNLEEMRPRLQALYQMTGGNPRLTMMLYELIAHESVDNVQNQFHLLLDRISPFYQGRLNDLPPGQRALLECLAGMRDQEKTPAAIAKRMRMSQQETSSLLKRLTDARYLRAARHPRDRRSRLYTIREGFFDIWLAMNLSRHVRRRMPFLVEFFSIFYPNVAAREEKRRQLYKKLLDEGSDDAEKALDYLSEVGDASGRAVAKFNMARISAHRRATKQAANYVLEAAPLAGDGVSRAILRTVESAPSETNYLSEIEEMVAAWEMYRSGRLEEFAHRLTEMGKGLTPLTFSETRLAFLRDTLESVDDAEKRIEQRLRIGEVLIYLARWKECEEQQRCALAEAEALSNSEVLALASNHLAYLLEHTNRLEEAESLMRRALEATEIAFGERHPNVVPLLGNLGSLLNNTSRVEEAKPLMRRALEIAEIAFGEGRPEAVPYLGHLASLLNKSNYTKDAEPLMRRALKAAGITCGERHMNVVPFLDNLANLLRDTSRVEEAEPLLRRALEIDEAAFGTQHPNVAVRLGNLGTLLRDSGRIEEAEPLLRRALEIDEAAFGTQHPNVAVRLGNLGTLLRDSGRVEEAEPLLRRALEIDKVAFGTQHPKVAIRLNNLGKMLLETNRLEEAEPLMRESLDISNSCYRQTGYVHPDSQRVTRNYQALRQAMGSELS